MTTDARRSEVLPLTKERADAMPLDVELIGDSAETVLTMTLGTSTREEIDAASSRMVGHLNLLLGEELGADDDPNVIIQYRTAYGLLDLTRRPTEATTAFMAFMHLRDIATVTRRLLRIYAERRGIRVP